MSGPANTTSPYIPYMGLIDNPVVSEAVRVLSPEGFCFIVDIDAGNLDYIEFQLMPDTISESKGAQYDRVGIIGRSLPILGYANSSSRTMNLSLEFAALNRNGQYSPSWIVEKVRWLESKVYPEYIEGWVYPPHKVLIMIGSVIGMTAVMTNCTTTWSKPWSQMSISGTSLNQSLELGILPFKAQVDCSFEECGKNNDTYGHPHGYAEAILGKNQAFQDIPSRKLYYEIPTVVSD
jgi:hypothetical protein